MLIITQVPEHCTEREGEQNGHSTPLIQNRSKPTLVSSCCGKVKSLEQGRKLEISYLTTSVFGIVALQTSSKPPHWMSELHSAKWTPWGGHAPNVPLHSVKTWRSLPESSKQKGIMQSEAWWCLPLVPELGMVVPVFSTRARHGGACL